MIKEEKVDIVTTKNNDMKGRRVINAAPSVNTHDYVIQQELVNGLKALNDSLPGAKNNQDILIKKLMPTVKLLTNSSTTGARFFSSSDDTSIISINLYFNGLAWAPDDVAKDGYMVALSIATGVDIWKFPAGGALTHLFAFDAAGLKILGGNKLFINAVQILTTQQADVGAPAAVSAITATNVPGATYTATEQTLFNQIKTDLANIKTTLDDNKTRLTNLRTIIRNHGLTA
jgi:hypothetical protein